jgi:Na+/proline symporter
MVVSADLWQRIYAAKSQNDARKGVLVGALFVLFGGLLLMIPSLASTGLLDANSDTQSALVMALRAYSPRIILGLAMAAVLMSVMSTLDSMVFVLSLSISHDFIVETLGRSVRYRKLGVQMAILLSLVLGAIFAIIFPKLLPVGIAVTSFALILAPPVIFSRTKKKMSTKSVNWSLSFGLFVAFALILAEFFVGNMLTPENSIAVFIGSILGAILGAIINRWFSKQKA